MLVRQLVRFLFVTFRVGQGRLLTRHFRTSVVKHRSCQMGAFIFRIRHPISVIICFRASIIGGYTCQLWTSILSVRDSIIVFVLNMC